MKKLKSVLFEENIGCGYLYFYVHFIIEVVCFFHLSRITNSPVAWLVPFLYDAFAFVPQGLIGRIVDKHPKINVSLIGVIFTFASFLLFGFNVNKFVTLFLICIGNCLIHVGGAENTLRNSKGKLSHSAIFVSGGSFGVITGKVLATYNIPIYLIIIINLLMIIPIIICNKYSHLINDKNLDKYNFSNKKINSKTIIALAVFVVIVRSFMGYGIPTTWNKTLIQAVYLYCAMGLGKAIGGLLIDSIGIKKTALISTIGALPFLLLGNNIMTISLIGIMMFSMTMAITLGIIVSELKKYPGVAFGLTTLGLFLGALPIFFFRINTVLTSYIIITSLTIISTIILIKICRKEKL